jgi:WD40 repeat protein/DNA-binding winged helix-turn-helix (wHTH) protein
MSLQFGGFELDQERRQLLRSDRPVPLEPKAYEVLLLLVERRPRALSRAQIRDVVWPGVFISESTLGVVVNSIRQALGDDARRPQFVRTVHGFGYAFCGEARDSTDGPGDAASVSTPEASSPYPGLLAFTEADAARFFGREVEVTALWEKIGRQQLLAVIGPSGVGKTSFLRAGVIPNRPEGWATAYVSPGPNLSLALARALIPGLARDAETIGELLQGVQELSLSGDPARVLSVATRWRQRRAHALVVVDQFEELFTLNPPGVQARHAELLGRLAGEADVHVLLSLRDDFLFRCSEREALRPVFQDLTPLAPLSPPALRRALRAPAAQRGVRFEDDALVEEMLETVGEGHGALPLLAFTVSRLWEERDRERRLLTRSAYEGIGGVTGALARHAEATLERIGRERQGIVREIFRNLVTSQGTREVMEREQLLSVFPDQKAAGAVLAELIGARLLTSYETAEISPASRSSRGAAAGSRAGGSGAEEAPATSGPRIEIVHESLLGSWLRLVRWQAQDAEGALLRDQLRQAARLWEDKGRPGDLLWTGVSYFEYRAWRSRYPGGLSALEEDFARAMTAMANRRRRQRRRAALALVVALALGLGVVTAFWARSEASRQQAEADARRALASQLVALGQMELDRYPTATVAYALRSLELSESSEARLLALRALQRGPTAILTPLFSPEAALGASFSPNGEWLALVGLRRAELFHRDGGGPLVLGADYGEGEGGLDVAFGPRSDVVVTDWNGDIRIYSLPDGRELRRETREVGPSFAETSPDGFTTATQIGPRWRLRRHTLDSGETQEIGSVVVTGEPAIHGPTRSLAYASGQKIYVRSLDDWASPPRLLAEHPARVRGVAFGSGGKSLVAVDGSDVACVWPVDARSKRPRRVVRAGEGVWPVPDESGRWVAAVGARDAGRNVYKLWDLSAPPASEPLVLRRADASYFNGLAFEPSGRWLASAEVADGTLWSMGGAYAHVISTGWVVDCLAFTPDGRALVSLPGADNVLRAWPLSADSPEESVLLRVDTHFPDLAMDSASRFVVLSTGVGGRHVLVPLDGGKPRELGSLWAASSGGMGNGVVALQGHRLAAAPQLGPLEDRRIRIVDVETGAVRRLPPVPGVFDREDVEFSDLLFLGEDRLLASVAGKGLLVFDLKEGRGQLVSSQPQGELAVSSDGRVAVGSTALPEWILAGRPGGLVRFALDGRPPQTLRSHGALVGSVALDPTGTLVATGSVDGTVRIGPVSGEEPHLLLGHEGMVLHVAFSSDGRWLASGGFDATIRLWPVPDVSKPPPHTLPRERFLTYLRSTTNLRAVPDPASPTGWKIDRGPFPGWARPPEW